MPLMYRMPTAFGNSPGPRSDLQGARFDWSAVKRTALRWQWAVDGDRLRRLLTPPFSLLGQPRLQLEVQQLENLPWLAGRGYTLFSVKAPVVFDSKQGPRNGSLLLVMWENLADPIITGREELGYPKVFCDLAWTKKPGGGIVGATASWFDHTFFRAVVEPSQTAPKAEAFPADLFHHRYIPAVGKWGEALVDQYTCSPGGAATPDSTADVDVRASFLPSSWEQIPTLWHIVTTLRELYAPGVSAGQLLTFRGGTDHYQQHVIA